MNDIDLTDRRYASRKFIFATAVWVAGTIGWAITPWFQIMTTDQWIGFSEWILGLYLAGNVGDTFASLVTKK